MLRIKLRKQDGVVMSDAIVAILIVILCTGIIITLMVNIVMESAKIKINSQQIDFATEILEYAEKLSYDEVTEETLINYVNNKQITSVSAGKTVETVSNSEATYKIGIQVETYETSNIELPQLDIVKIITVTIENKFKDKTYSTTISSIKKATIDEAKEKIN